MRISDWSQTCALPIAVRDESHQRQRLAARILRRAEYAAHPDGFHLWLKVPEPWSRAGFTEYLRASGIGVVASDAFVVGIQAPEAVRIRSEERRVGKECVRQGRSRWSPFRLTK